METHTVGIIELIEEQAAILIGTIQIIQGIAIIAGIRITGLIKEVAIGTGAI